MIKYSDIKTGELIDLLYSESVRVEMGLIKAVAERGEEAAAPLRLALADEENWYEGSHGKYWIVQHAMVILSLMRDEEALPLMFEMLPHAYFSDHLAAIDAIVPTLANFGPPAIPFCMDFITAYRGAFRDNPDYAYCRYKAALVLALIARSDVGLRPEATEFLCGLYEDDDEDDRVFLSFSVSLPVALDSDRGFDAIRRAYDRGAIDKSLCGTFAKLRDSYDDPGSNFFIDLDDEINTIDYLYQPDIIQKNVREKEKQVDENLYWGTPEFEAPAGFQFTEGGNLVNPVKIGRNDPCSCGSGKKYKKCCGANGG